MAQILPHLLTMIHSAPDGAAQGSASPATILTWALWGCIAAAVGALLITATKIALGPSCGPGNPKLVWTLIACVGVGSSFAIAGGLS
jgi:hypothetical protein